MTTTEGPLLEGLLRRLAECPPEFQLSPWLENAAKGGRGVVHVDALVRDWFLDAGLDPLAPHEAARFRTVSAKAKSSELTETPASVPLAGAPAGASTAAAAGTTSARAKGKDKADSKALLAEKEKQEQAATAWLRLVSLSIWLLHDSTFLQGKPRRPNVLTFLNSELDEVAQVADATHYITDGDRREELVRRALRAFGMRPARESREHADDRLTTLDSVELRRVAIASRQAEERARAIREAMARKAAEEAAATYNRE